MKLGTQILLLWLGAVVGAITLPLGVIKLVLMCGGGLAPSAGFLFIIPLALAHDYEKKLIAKYKLQNEKE